MRTIKEIKADIELCKKCVEKQLADNGCKFKCQLCEFINASNINDLEIELCQAITANIHLDRLEQICNAERDGRLVIQPCKQGDKVWEIETKTIAAVEVVAIWFNGLRYIVVCDGIGELILGKDVFLTKEEAKNALKGDNDETD